MHILLSHSHIYNTYSIVAESSKSLCRLTGYVHCNFTVFMGLTAQKSGGKLDQFVALHNPTDKQLATSQL